MIYPPRQKHFPQEFLRFWRDPNSNLSNGHSPDPNKVKKSAKCKNMLGNQGFLAVLDNVAQRWYPDIIVSPVYGGWKANVPTNHGAADMHTHARGSFSAEQGWLLSRTGLVSRPNDTHAHTRARAHTHTHTHTHPHGNFSAEQE